MGEMLLNGRLYGASGIRELTQAQYDALPASKLTDGILYCIKDTGIVEGDKYAPVIYSLEEREVGVWTDGKPLYQKTKIYTSGLTPSTSEQLLDNNIASNIDELFFVNSGSYVLLNTGRRFTNLAYYDGSNYQCNISVVGKNSYYVIKFGSDTISRIVLTYFYTKTTDIPGSGTWGTDGVPMVHYDGNEKIIGTWFGETLYEKTIDCGYLLNNAMKDVSVDISNLGIIYKISGIMVTDQVSANVPYLGTWNTGTPDDEVGCYYTSGILRIKTRTDRTAYRCYITLQYTKTS